MTRYFRDLGLLARVEGDFDRCEVYHWQLAEWHDRDHLLAAIQWSGDWDEITEAEALAIIRAKVREAATV